MPVSSETRKRFALATALRGLLMLVAGLYAVIWPLEALAVLLVFGAPKVGTPIMDATPLAGLDLPVKILVWNREDRTMIGYLDPAELGRRHGVSDAASDQLAMMTKVLDKIASAGVE